MKFILLITTLLLPLSSYSLCVKNDRVKLRSKPHEKAKVNWVVGAYMPLLEIERKGAWYQVQDFEGEKHWIHARHISYKESCVVVKAQKANLRIGPGTKFPQTDLGSVSKYAVFRKVGRDDDWLKVQDVYGQVHWAHETTLWEPRTSSRVSF